MNEKERSETDEIIDRYEKALEDEKERPARETAAKEEFLKGFKEVRAKIIQPEMKKIKEGLEKRGYYAEIVIEDVSEINKEPAHYDAGITMYISFNEIDLNERDALKRPPYIKFRAFTWDLRVTMVYSSFSPVGAQPEERKRFTLADINRKGFVHDLLIKFVRRFFENLMPK